MTSGSPPPTIPSVSTGTPPKEWSESVLKSSAEESDTPAKVPTIPGALDLNIMDEPEPEQEPKAPKEAERQPKKGAATQGSKEATSVPATVGTTAKRYVLEQVEPIVQYASQAAAAVAAYLSIPQSVKEAVASYTPSKEPRQEEHHVSLPSEELKGAQPREHTGGVGALPGNVSESSVALLPEERQERELPAAPPQGVARERRDTIKPSAATTIVAESEQTQPREWEKAEQAKISGDAELPKDELVSSMPSDISTKASTEPIEAGAIKARLVETSEAEKAKTSDAGQAGEGGGEAAADAGVSSVGNVSGAGETGEKKQDKEPSAASEKADQEKGPTRDGPPTKEGYGGDYHPAQMHPPPPGTSVAEYRTSLVVQREEEHEAPPSPTQARRASGGAGKKAGFMAMVKGEMKVLAGKMSGDEEKVAEGKKLMHREG